ncbi:MAG TPA: glycosyltransferase family 4 protein [Sphingomicrobium sp.]|nr:glycosyltransferase family 4 protein [Sphingomicrobium sp.]
MRLIALTKYDREAAATRQRFLQYAPALAKAGIELRHRPLIGDDYVRSIGSGKRWSRTALLRSYARRFAELFRGPGADVLWVHAELFPYLPAMFDRLAFRHGIPVIYDWDDAFFLNYNESRNPLIRLMLRGKIERLIASASAATCGNEFLCDYAARYCPDSMLLPTVVDTDVYRPDVRERERLVIGWIGSPTTWGNVRPIFPLLREICAETNACFRVVGAGTDAEADRFPGMEFVAWSEESEVAEVQGFDIGIMPLIDAPFERGKSGYKLVQYMACGIPAIASPVGANKTVLGAGSGCFATTDDEWSAALRRLIADAALRKRLGDEGRERAIAHYSLQAHAPRLIALLEEVARPGRAMPHSHG